MKDRVSTPRLRSFKDKLHDPFVLECLVNTYYGWFNDPRINDTLSPTLPKTREDIRNMFITERDNPLSRRFLIYADWNLVGHIGCPQIDPIKREAEIAYVNGCPNMHNWGIMTKALFELRYELAPEVDRLTAIVQSHNVASMNVLRENGFQPMGTFIGVDGRERITFEGRTQPRPFIMTFPDQYHMAY